MVRDARFVVGPSGLPWELDDDTPVYSVSVAARLSGLHPQTLRQYDRLGLVSPGRTGGGGRRYSPRDIARLREVQRLSQSEGVNLAGIERILALEDEVAGLRSQTLRLEHQVQLLRAELALWLSGSPRRREPPALTARAEAAATMLLWSSPTRS